MNYIEEERKARKDYYEQFYEVITDVTEFEDKVMAIINEHHKPSIVLTYPFVEGEGRKLRFTFEKNHRGFSISTQELADRIMAEILWEVDNVVVDIVFNICRKTTDCEVRINDYDRKNREVGRTTCN